MPQKLPMDLSERFPDDSLVIFAKRGHKLQSVVCDGPQTKVCATRFVTFRIASFGNCLPVTGRRLPL